MEINLKFENIINSYTPNARNGASHWMVDNRYLYIFGGAENEKIFNDFRFYDIKNEKWCNVKIEEEKEEEESIPSPRFGSIFFNFIDEIGHEHLCLLSGFSNNKTLNDFWMYGLNSQKWVQITNLPEDFILGAYSSYWVHNNRLYIFGGMEINDGPNVLNNLLIYDIEKNKMENLQIKSDMPCGRFNSNFWKCTINNVTFFYLLNGMRFTKNNQSIQLDDFWRFDTDKLVWEVLSSVPNNYESKNSSIIWKINKNIYIYGGINSNNTIFDDLWVYNIDEDSFNYMELDDIKPCNRSDVCVWNIKNNNIYIYGGLGEESHLNDMWKIKLAKTSNRCCFFF